MWNLQILTSSVLFRKSFLKDKEFFSNKITRGQETELFSRLFFQLSNESYRIINLSLFLYQQHPDTKTSRNKEYVKSYKESQSYIFVENLRKSILINNLELIQYHYKLLIDNFFSGIENNLWNNSRYILKHLNRVISLINKKLSLELFIFGNLLLLLKRGSYRIEKRFRKYKVK